MKKNNPTKTDLRQQAEEKLSKRKKSPAMDKDPLRLIHELEVHQIELEMQNEELVQARAEAEVVHHQYTDLYDFAPVGYFTLTRDGSIRMSNLTGASLLAVERGKLVKRRFGVFVSVESRPVFNRFLEKVFSANGGKEGCEIMLLKDGQESCWMRLDAVSSEDQLECHVAMKDITARKQVEEALRISEEKYHSVVTAIREGIVMQVRSGEIIACNPMAEKILGLTQDQMMGRTSVDPRWQSVREDGSPFPGDTHPSMLTLQNGQAVRNAVMGVHKSNGELTWININSEPLCRPDERLPYAVVTTFFDITERKQAEETLIENELKYRALFETATDAILLFTEGRWVDCNAGALHVFGCNREQIIGAHPIKFSPPMQPDGRPSKEESIKKINLAFAGEPQYFEWEHCRLDGTPFAAEVSLNRLDLEGKPYMQAIVRDVSERKQAAEVLRGSEERFKAIANYAVSWESWFGPDGKYIWVNPGVEHFTGYSAQEILAMPDFTSTVIADEDRSTFIKRFQEALRGNREENFEFRYLHKNGAKRWLSASWQPIYDAQGKPLGVRSSGHDITERKQAEEKLILIMKAVESASDAVGISDAQGHHFYQNRALTELFGYATAAELQAAGGGAVVVKDPEVAKEMFGAIMSGRSWTGELEIVTKSGRVFPAYERADAIKDNEDNIIGLIGIITDITERKQMEQALRESEEQLLMSQQIGRAGSWGYNLETDKIWGSLEGLRIYGLPLVPDDYPIAEIEACIPERERVHQALVDLINEGRKYDLEFVINPADGSAPKVVNSKARLEKDANGKPLKVLGFLQDITERKQAEDALQKSKQLLEKTMSSLLDAVFIIDADTVEIMDCNPAASAIFGYSRQEMLGQTTAFLHVSQESLEEFSQHLHSDMEAAKDFMFLPEFKMKRKDGTVFFSEHSVVP
jgi:PAS domain S-box-containing protein